MHDISRKRAIPGRETYEEGDAVKGPQKSKELAVFQVPKNAEGDLGKERNCRQGGYRPFKEGSDFANGITQS